ncbi:hypothetical protein [Streptomyces sp. NPDC056160]|uniref:hypothetical protein n=1 Tax=Streptomyces sp. NPDC056160 TaxID=3345731 RepID=UPI0035DCEE6E
MGSSGAVAGSSAVSCRRGSAEVLRRRAARATSPGLGGWCAGSGADDAWASGAGAAAAGVPAGDRCARAARSASRAASPGRGGWGRSGVSAAGSWSAAARAPAPGALLRITGAGSPEWPEPSA